MGESLVGCSFHVRGDDSRFPRGALQVELTGWNDDRTEMLDRIKIHECLRDSFLSNKCFSTIELVLAELQKAKKKSAGRQVPSKVFS